MAPKAEEEGESSSSEANGPVAAPAPRSSILANQGGGTSDVGRFTVHGRSISNNNIKLVSLHVLPKNTFGPPLIEVVIVHTFKS